MQKSSRLQDPGQECSNCSWLQLYQMPHAAQSQTMIPQEKGKLGRHITHLAPSVIFANVFNHKQV